jgi:hypothetical protein
MHGDFYVNYLKKQSTCIEKELDAFQWILSMPLDNSHAQKTSAKAFTEEYDEKIVFAKDIKAP